MAKVAFDGHIAEAVGLGAPVARGGSVSVGLHYDLVGFE
jgi:hypothetical protein